jgi:hypothetical protein
MPNIQFSSDSVCAPLPARRRVPEDAHSLAFALTPVKRKARSLSSAQHFTHYAEGAHKSPRRPDFGARMRAHKSGISSPGRAARAAEVNRYRSGEADVRIT